MKKLAITSIILLTTFCVFAHEGAKIGVVDADVVIQKSAKGQAFFEEYQQFIQTKEDKIKAMIETYQTQKKIYKPRPPVFPRTRRSICSATSRKWKPISNANRKMRRVKPRTCSMNGSSFSAKNSPPLIRQVANDLNLDIVMNHGPQSALVFVKETVIITENVIKKYDEMQ